MITIEIGVKYILYNDKSMLSDSVRGQQQHLIIIIILKFYNQNSLQAAVPWDGSPAVTLAFMIVARAINCLRESSRTCCVCARV